MSLILEALRKSEAERRRGQAPGLFTPDAGMLTPAQKSNPTPLLIAIALLLAALVWAGMRWTRADGEQSRATALAEPATPALIAINTDAMTGTNTRPMAAATDTTAAANSSMPPAPRTPPVTIPSAAAATPAVIPTPPVAIGPATITPELTVQPTVASEPATPTLAALAADRRSALPALKLSMHVYNDTPEKRFAIIDGQRIAEGASLGPAVVLAIRRDGVLLGIDGQAYLLPRP